MILRSNPKLAIVVPCYNEQETIETTILRLLEVLKELEDADSISKESFLYLVDDGSLDGTFEIIKDFNAKNKKVKALKFARNFGNQNALLAGMLGARKICADCTVTIDADLQQDEGAIKDFVQKYKEGNEIVLGIRKNSQKSLFKDFTSAVFYKFMSILGAKVTPNHSEYRLMGKKALDVLAQYGEYNLFLRGVLHEIGFKKAHVSYIVRERKAGQTKFNFRSLCSLAVNAVTSFSVKPLRFVGILGVILALFSFGFGLEVMWEKYMLQNTIPGWSTIVVCVCFFSGVQIFCLGIMGEYLGQVYKEVKARPRYIKDVELI